VTAVGFAARSSGHNYMQGIPAPPMVVTSLQDVGEVEKLLNILFPMSGQLKRSAVAESDICMVVTPRFNCGSWSLAQSVLRWCHRESLMPTMETVLAQVHHHLVNPESFREADLLALLQSAPEKAQVSVQAVAGNCVAVVMSTGEQGTTLDTALPVFSAMTAGTPELQSLAQLVSQHCRFLFGLGCKAGNAWSAPDMLAPLRSPQLGRALLLPPQLQTCSGGALWWACSRAEVDLGINAVPGSWCGSNDGLTAMPAQPGQPGPWQGTHCSGNAACSSAQLAHLCGPMSGTQNMWQVEPVGFHN